MSAASSSTAAPADAADGALDGRDGADRSVSRLWLSYGAFGPAEWLWRMFTYRRRSPLFG